MNLTVKHFVLSSFLSFSAQRLGWGGFKEPFILHHAPCFQNLCFKVALWSLHNEATLECLHGRCFLLYPRRKGHICPFPSAVAFRKKGISIEIRAGKIPWEWTVDESAFLPTHSVSFSIACLSHRIRWGFLSPFHLLERWISLASCLPCPPHPFLAFDSNMRPCFQVTPALPVSWEGARCMRGWNPSLALPPTSTESGYESDGNTPPPSPVSLSNPTSGPLECNTQLEAAAGLGPHQPLGFPPPVMILWTLVVYGDLFLKFDFLLGLIWSPPHTPF